MIQFRAHFDGKNLCPDEPVSLPEGVPLSVRVVGDVEVAEMETAPLDATSKSELPAKGIDLAAFFDRIESEPLDGPSDLSVEHDHYLYGGAKKSDGRS